MHGINNLLNDSLGDDVPKGLMFCEQNYDTLLDPGHAGTSQRP